VVGLWEEEKANLFVVAGEEDRLGRNFFAERRNLSETTPAGGGGVRRAPFRWSTSGRRRRLTASARAWEEGDPGGNS